MQHNYHDHRPEHGAKQVALLRRAVSRQRQLRAEDRRHARGRAQQLPGEQGERGGAGEGEEAKAEEARIKNEEAKIKAEERRLEREEKRNLRSEYDEPEDDYSDALMDKLKRLKRLYKNGTLSKA